MASTITITIGDLRVISVECQLRLPIYELPSLNQPSTIVTITVFDGTDGRCEHYHSDLRLKIYIQSTDGQDKLTADYGSALRDKLADIEMDGFSLRYE